MADGSLAQYNGSAGFLVDSNIWIDCIDAASPWHDWAVDQVQACGERAPLHGISGSSRFWMYVIR